MCKLSKILTLVWVTLLFISCGRTRPNDILSPEQMEAFLYDFHIAKAFGDDEDYTQRYKKEFYTDYAFQKHNLTKEDVDKSLMWYTRHVGELKEIYENISKRFEADKIEMDQLVAWQYDIPLVTVAGDSVDIWAWHREYRLTGTPLNNKIIFNLPVDSNFVQKDSIHWSVNYDFGASQSLDSLTYAVMQMALFFTNDSSIIYTNTIKSSGIHSIAVKSDSLWNIKNVQGFIYLPPQPKATRLLLDSISMYRYHPLVEVDSIATGVEEPEMIEEK